MQAGVGLVGDQVCLCCASSEFLYCIKVQEVGGTWSYCCEFRKFMKEVKNHTIYSGHMVTIEEFIVRNMEDNQVKFAFHTIFTSNNNKGSSIIVERA